MIDKGVILKIIERNPSINIKAVCRLLNYRLECPQEYNPKSGYLKCVETRCDISYFEVLRAVKELRKEGLIHSKLVKKYDGNPKARGRRKDLFRELYLSNIPLPKERKRTLREVFG